MTYAREQWRRPGARLGLLPLSAVTAALLYGTATVSAAWSGQSAACATAAPAAASVEVVKGTAVGPRGDVVHSSGGARKTVGTDAWRAWLVEGGSAVVYSRPAGASGYEGGYEGEGETLWRYDRRTGRTTRLLTDDFPIESVADARSASGRAALMVLGRDSGAGNPSVSVVDPGRGQVWRHVNASFAGPAARGRVTVRVHRLYCPENDGSDERRPVARTITVDLDRTLRGPARAEARVGTAPAGVGGSVTVEALRWAPGGGGGGVTASGAVRGYDSARYEFAGKKGQRLTARLTSGSTSLCFDLLAPRTGAALGTSPSPREATSWTGTLPEDGVYTVQVYQVRAAARRGKTARYTLSLSAREHKSHETAAGAGPE